MTFIDTRNILLLLVLVICLCCQEKNVVPLHQQFIGMSLKGNWKKIGNTKSTFGIGKLTKNGTIYGYQNEKVSPFESFFDNEMGVTEVLISQKQEQTKLQIYIQLIDNKYINEKVAQLSLTINKWYKKDDSWKSPTFMTGVMLYKNMEYLATLDIELYLQIKENISENKVQIMLKSDSVSIQLNIQEFFPNLHCFFLFTTINTLQIILLLYFDKNRRTLASTSEWLILQQSLYLLLQTFLLLKISISYLDTKLSLLLLNVFTNILVMILILKKFETVLQKFKNRLKFILAFIFCFIYFRLMFLYYTHGFLWVIESMIFLWQIAYSIQRGDSGVVSFTLVAVIIVSRIPLFIAMKTYSPILKLRPDNEAGGLIIASMLMHLILICLQKMKGGRFFTPKRIIPNFFDYLRKTTYQTTIAQQQCSICLNELRAEPDESEEKLKQRKQKEVNFPNFEKTEICYVSTPCNHRFHKKCLSDWLATHLICPLDKRDLPPMNLGTF